MLHRLLLGDEGTQIIFLSLAVSEGAGVNVTVAGQDTDKQTGCKHTH